MKKLVTCILTMIVSLLLIFFVIQSMPGDPVKTLAQDYIRTGQMTYDQAYNKAKLALNYDPDEPVLNRFVTYVKGIATGNLGQSMSFKESVSTIVLEALPWTLLVCSISLFLSFSVGVILGIYVAWKRSKVLEGVLTGYQAILGSIPDYIVAYLLVLLFSLILGLFPSKGAYSSTVTPGFNFEFIISVLKHAALPILAYFLTTLAGWIMGMKANCLSVLGEDYINYAKARGISNKRIIFSYLGRNAMLPMVTSVAISFGMMFGGSPLIENLFVYPGVGYYLTTAISRRDYPLMQGMFLMIIVMVLLSGVFAEFLNTRLNPRLREK
ncbi:ABC transporter permease [uncultured Clostridium sp.]|uniref:ABC transporter permease n=1 Tax=uncultured Clostridium sp. TaxID=59620 RepID=UPI0025D4C7C1|nr:ABC transporter permease [uncultured Clostridium sp.]MDU2491199.1 ABC transporter permease [Clostridium celatum]MDU4884150.1 ABC transporter permease [Clostridium celatum]MDU7077359.1 ABC transporter permease [Clostridium celatum]